MVVLRAASNSLLTRLCVEIAHLHVYAFHAAHAIVSCGGHSSFAFTVFTEQQHRKQKKKNESQSKL